MAFQSVISAVRQSTGNNKVATISITISFLIPFLFPVFLSTLYFPIEGVLKSKNLFYQSSLKYQKPRGRPLSKARQQFWDLLAAILDFAGIAGGEPVSLAVQLGWYSLRIPRIDCTFYF